MSSLIGILEDKFADKLRGVMGDWGAMPLFVPTKEEKFGDYQCNVALSCAKKQGVKPRELAEKAAEILRTEGGDCFAEVGIAGPGFINLRLLDGFLRSVLPSSCDGAQDGAAYCGQPGTVLGFVPNDVKVVVDYSSPNIAKQMHVGHLRSSIIGDSICRVLDFLGYQVVRQNHVGDWGTQFGLLCAWLMDHTEESLRGDVDLSDLEALYRQAQALANEDPVFHEQSRQRVVALHQGDAETIATWRYIVRKSLGHIENTYALLGVLLRNEDMRGESFYNPMLGALVEELQRKYPAGSRPLEVTVSQGATCIFMYDEAGQPLFKGTDDEPQPMIIRKADGAFLYPTTDLAALRGTYRIIPETDGAVRALFDILREVKIRKANILLDEPVSNSGRLKALIADIGESYPFELDIRILKDVDRALYEKEYVITSDSIILDHCRSWANPVSSCLARRGRQRLRVWSDDLNDK